VKPKMSLAEFCLQQGRRVLRHEITSDQYVDNINWYKSELHKRSDDPMIIKLRQADLI